MLSNGFRSIRRRFGSIFPPACAGCDGVSCADSAFCEICRPLAPAIEPPFCARCKVPMQAFSSPDEAPSECSRCRRDPPDFRSVEALWEYDDAVADAIRRIKYGHDLPALRALCRGARLWFEDTLHKLPSRAPIVPIPAHRTALRRRGFHLPTLALQLLGARRTHPVEARLQKTEPTPRQASLKLDERRKNVRGVFRDIGAPPGGGPIIVFDDVLTTGATVDAAAETLKKAGFDDVYIIVLARALTPGMQTLAST